MCEKIHAILLIDGERHIYLERERNRCRERLQLCMVELRGIFLTFYSSVFLKFYGEHGLLVSKQRHTM